QQYQNAWTNSPPGVTLWGGNITCPATATAGTMVLTPQQNGDTILLPPCGPITCTTNSSTGCLDINPGTGVITGIKVLSPVGLGLTATNALVGSGFASSATTGT